MRKLWLLILGLGLVACSQATDKERAIVEKYPPATVQMDLQKVSEHVYFVQGKAGVATDNQGFISNAGFIVTKAGVVVFDTLGSPALGRMLYDHIRSVTPLPIVKVVLSHYHADHIYGLQLFKELGAEIIAPRGAYDYLNSPQAAERLEERRFSLEPWVNDKTYLVEPDQVIEKPQSFKVGEMSFTLNVLGAAHSDGDMTMFIEPDRVLFSGDIIFEGRVPYLGDANTKNWLETLQKMELNQLIALIPGHGPAAKNPNQAVTATRHYLARVREVMGKAVADFQDFASAYEQADWSEFEKLPAFAEAHRRNAYQVFLSMEQEELQNK